jgi:hypothetical protein
MRTAREYPTIGSQRVPLEMFCLGILAPWRGLSFDALQTAC